MADGFTLPTPAHSSSCSCDNHASGSCTCQATASCKCGSKCTCEKCPEHQKDVEAKKGTKGCCGENSDPSTCTCGGECKCAPGKCSCANCPSKNKQE